MPENEPMNHFQNSENTFQDTLVPFPNTMDENSAEAARGLAITQEQISDVYNAGTSDGILILEGGIIVNLKED